MLTAEQLKTANEQIKTVQIKQKDYAQVTERVKAFRSVCPGGRITTEIISLDNGVVTMKAVVSDEDGRVIATGLAQEKESSSFINKTSYIENCETSAVGRALGFAGIGVDGSMASAEEVANAVINQNIPEQAPKQGYPSRDEMMAAIVKKYPAGSKQEKALLMSNGLQKFEDMTDAQTMSIYNYIMKQAK